MIIELFIPISPKPWTVRKARHFYNVNRGYIDEVQAYIREHYKEKPHTCPIALSFVHYLPIPAHISKRAKLAYLNGSKPHQVRPDTTNLNKQMEDCLTGILFHDDKQVVMIKGKKKYGENPGTWIKVYEYKDD